MAYNPALKARPTTYKGTEMRSRLEASYAAWLDSKNIEWQYEPRCFAGTSGQYLPDFLIDDRTYIEIKPDVGKRVHEDALTKMHVILESEPEAFLLVVVGTDNGGFARGRSCTPMEPCGRCGRRSTALDALDPCVWSELLPASWSFVGPMFYTGTMMEHWSDGSNSVLCSGNFCKVESDLDGLGSGWHSKSQMLAWREGVTEHELASEIIQRARAQIARERLASIRVRDVDGTPPAPPRPRLASLRVRDVDGTPPAPPRPVP